MKYEEFADLKVDMVRQYLAVLGWTFGKQYSNGCFAANPSGDFEFPLADNNCHLGELAVYENITTQALLRKINPRMRPGLPGEAAWLAHGGEEGWWIGIWNVAPEQAGLLVRSDLVNRPIITKIYRNPRDHWDWGLPGIGFSHWPGHPSGNDWTFWPCDKYGNKLPPYPADSQVTSP